MCLNAMNNPIRSAIPARTMNESGLLAASAPIAPKPDAMKQKRSVLDGVYMGSRISKNYSLIFFLRLLLRCGMKSHPQPNLCETNDFSL